MDPRKTQQPPHRRNSLSKIPHGYTPRGPDEMHAFINTSRQAAAEGRSAIDKLFDVIKQLEDRNVMGLYSEARALRPLLQDLSSCLETEIAANIALVEMRRTTVRPPMQRPPLPPRSEAPKRFRDYDAPRHTPPPRMREEAPAASSSSAWANRVADAARPSSPILGGRRGDSDEEPIETSEAW